MWWKKKKKRNCPQPQVSQISLIVSWSISVLPLGHTRPNLDLENEETMARPSYSTIHWGPGIQKQGNHIPSFYPDLTINSVAFKSQKLCCKLNEFVLTVLSTGHSEWMRQSWLEQEKRMETFPSSQIHQTK